MQKVEALKTRDELFRFNNSLLNHKNGKPKRYGETYWRAWNLGINVALRISDLSVLRFDDVFTQDGSSFINITEKKTGKKRLIGLNKKALAIIQLQKESNSKSDFIFSLRKNTPLTRQSYSRRFKQAAIDAGIERPISTHSMRKTRGCVLYADGVPVETIARVLNHSSTSTTLLYLGITDAEVNQTYIDYEL